MYIFYVYLRSSKNVTRKTRVDINFLGGVEYVKKRTRDFGIVAGLFIFAAQIAAVRRRSPIFW